jgi:hypothetical protein
METPSDPIVADTTPVPDRSAPYGFAAALAIMGAIAVVAASLLPYAISVGQQGRLVDLNAPFKEWVWAAIPLWGMALAILAAGVSLLPGRAHPLLLAGILVAFGLEAILLYGSILGQLMVTENVDPQAGTYVGVIAGLIVVVGGILGYRTWKRGSVST